MGLHQQIGLGVDIDDTISSTAEQWMEQLLETFGNPEGLTAADMLARYGYAQHVPYWQTVEALAWMEERRNSIAEHKSLRPIEGSSSILRTIHTLAPVVAYITARPIGVIEATIEWLESHQFPNAPIIARPDHVRFEDSSQWKASVLVQLYPHVSGFIDDNVSLLRWLPPDYAGTIFLYGHRSAPSIQSTRTKVVPCPTWDAAKDRISTWVSVNAGYPSEKRAKA